MKVLIVVDMQNDFITGSLGSEEAQAIVPTVVEKIKAAKAEGATVVATLDTHYFNYLSTLEGERLPIPHCEFQSKGWELDPRILEAIGGEMDCYRPDFIQKNTFGVFDIATKLDQVIDVFDNLDNLSFEICGLCTDICVVANAIALRIAFPDNPISIDHTACAGSSVAAHEAALMVMKSQMIDVI